MHASLDTDIHEGIERNGPGTMRARAVVGFVPTLPFGSRENSILEGGCIGNATKEREPGGCRPGSSPLFTRQ